LIGGLPSAMALVKNGNFENQLAAHRIGEA
jgi:hypothetical protein